MSPGDPLPGVAPDLRLLKVLRAGSCGMEEWMDGCGATIKRSGEGVEGARERGRRRGMMERRERGKVEGKS